MSATINAQRTRGKRFTLSAVPSIGCLFLICSVFGLSARAQSSKTTVQFDPSTRVFRMDAADTTYVIGINDKEQVQSLYWGKRLSAEDRLSAAKSLPGYASFDLPVNTTPQDFVGWGGGLFVEPDLKITFPDGNRDLVLKYVSNKIDQNRLAIVMKDIRARCM